MDVKTQNQQESQNDEKLEDVAEEMLNRLREGQYLEIIRKLRLELADKSNECELLKLKLDQSNEEVDILDRKLNECKLTVFENNEDSKKTHEEIMKSKRLEEDYIKLMSDYLALGERNNQYKQGLSDNYLKKTNAINNYQCLMSSGVLAHELESCKQEMDNKLAELNLAVAKVRNLEEDNVIKEKCISDLRKALDDAKVTHKHEITVLKEYIQCLDNTTTTYKNMLANYTSIESQES